MATSCRLDCLREDCNDLIHRLESAFLSLLPLCARAHPDLSFWSPLSLLLSRHILRDVISWNLSICTTGITKHFCKTNNNREILSKYQSYYVLTSFGHTFSYRIKLKHTHVRTYERVHTGHITFLSVRMDCSATTDTQPSMCLSKQLPPSFPFFPQCPVSPSAPTCRHGLTQSAASR